MDEKKFGGSPYGEVKMTVDGQDAPGFTPEDVLQGRANENVDGDEGKGVETAEKSSVEIGKERVGRAKEWFKSKWSGAMEKVKAYSASFKDDAELAAYQVAGAPEALGRAAGQVGEKISETGSALKAGAEQKAAEAGAFVGRKVSEGTAAIKGDVEQVIGSGKEKINQVKGKCTELYLGAKTRVDDAKNAFNEKRNNIRDRAMGAVASVREKIENFQKLNAEIRKKREEIQALKQARMEMLGFAH